MVVAAVADGDDDDDDDDGAGNDEELEKELDQTLNSQELSAANLARLVQEERPSDLESSQSTLQSSSSSPQLSSLTASSQASVSLSQVLLGHKRPLGVNVAPAIPPPKRIRVAVSATADELAGAEDEDEEDSLSDIPDDEVLASGQAGRHMTSGQASCDSRPQPQRRRSRR